MPRSTAKRRRLLSTVFAILLLVPMTSVIRAESKNASQRATKRQCAGKGQMCGGDAKGYCCPGLICSGGFRNMYCK